MMQHNTIGLGAHNQLLEICDPQDVTIAAIAGEGSLTLDDETVPLEPGRFVLIPARVPHTVRTQTSLTFLITRCESDLGLDDSAWMMTF
jgi:quercetin dioxygenase-like cupin family protein